MAITFEQQPKALQPVNNPLIFVCSSTNTNQTNFSYVVELRTTKLNSGSLNPLSANTSILTKHKLPARPDTGELVFDASDILRDQLSFDFDRNDSTIFQKSPNSWITYALRVGEEWSGQSETNFVDSNDEKTFNGALAYDEWIDFDRTDYTMKENNPGKFLTNSPSTIKDYKRGHAQLHFLAPTSFFVEEVFIDQYDANDSLLDSSRVDDTSLFQEVGHFKCGYADLKEQTFFPQDGLKYYQVYTAWDPGLFSFERTSERKTFQLECENRFDVIRIHFLNRLGGFDFFDFNKRSEETIGVDRQRSRQSVGTHSSGSFSFARKDRGLKENIATYQKEVEVISDWLSDEEFKWLQELITSPVVYEEREVGKYRAILINNDDYTIRKRVNGNIYNITLNYIYSIQNSSQRI